MASRVTAILAVVALTGAGCGSDSDSGESSASTDLAASLPGDPTAVYYLDLEATRQELGVAADTDPVSEEALTGDADDEQAAELYLTAGIVLPHVTESFSERFELDATGEAIDHSQVSAAASGEGGDGGRAVVLATDQPFDEIAQSLEAAGFEADGDVLSGANADPEPAFPYVAETGDGTVVLATELAAAEEAAAGETSASDAAALAGKLDQPQRQALAAEQDCVRGFAVGGDAVGGELEIVIRVDGEPDADRVANEAALISGGTIVLGEAEVDGDLVRVTATAPEGGDEPTGEFAGGGVFTDDVYECR
jgi:hypothetical protein